MSRDSTSSYSVLPLSHNGLEFEMAVGDERKISVSSVPEVVSKKDALPT